MDPGIQKHRETPNGWWQGSWGPKNNKKLAPLEEACLEEACLEEASLEEACLEEACLVEGDCIRKSFECDCIRKSFERE